MAKTYFTLTGTKHYYGRDFLEKGMQVKLIKELDNDYDREHERRQTLRQVWEQRNCNRTADNRLRDNMYP